MSRFSPVDPPNKKLKAVLKAEERLENASLRLAEKFGEPRRQRILIKDSSSAFANGVYERVELPSKVETEFLRAAKALKKLRDDK